jgi:hypothetical protein
MLFQQLLHGVADVNLAGEDDVAVEWAIPVGLALHVEGIPREETVAVGQQQTLDREVATNGYQTVVLAPPWIGEPQLIV